MGVTVQRSFGDLRELLPGGQSLMQEVGDFATRLIRTRTEQERDKDGNPFHPLSTRYALQKVKALGNARADLTVSGRMLNDMGVVGVTDTSVEISFRSQGGGSGRGTFIQRSRALGAADKAFFHVTGNHGVIRDFFGLTDEEEALIAGVVDNDVARRMAQL